MRVFRYLYMVVFLFSAFAKADVKATPIMSNLAAVTAVTTQCAMCRAVLESEEDNSTAKGINNGIKYLMIIPYILVGGVFYFVYKTNIKSKNKTAKNLEE